MKRPKLDRTVLIAAAIIVVLLAAIGVLGWKYLQTANTPEVKAKQTSARIVERVAAIYLVPTDEEPTIALIQDKTKLTNQEFFKKAQNGDYLIIYKNNKLAMVYRESSNKIITVGPINLDTSTPQNTTQPTTDTSDQPDSQDTTRQP